MNTYVRLVLICFVLKYSVGDSKLQSVTPRQYDNYASEETLYTSTSIPKNDRITTANANHLGIKTSNVEKNTEKALSTETSTIDTNEFMFGTKEATSIFNNSTTDSRETTNNIKEVNIKDNQLSQTDSSTTNEPTTMEKTTALQTKTEETTTDQTTTEETITDQTTTEETTTEQTTTGEATTQHATTEQTTTINPCQGIPPIIGLKVVPTHDSMTVSWYPFSYPKKCKLRYVFRHKTSHGSKFYTYRETKNIKFVLKNLKSCTDYNLVVKAQTDFEVGPDVARKVTTLPGQVRRFTIEVEQNRTVLFWKKSEYPTCVTYNVLKDNTILAKNISTNTFVLSTRNFNCNNFGVQIVGVGNLLGKPVYGNVPGKVRNLTIEKKTQTNITVAWDVPEKETCVIGYQLVINLEKAVYVTDTNYTFENLTLCTLYNIKVAAFSDSNNIGQSSFLQTRIEAARNDITAVQMLTASQTEDTINISWKAPINLEECDITYNINVDNISYTSLDTFIDIENIIPCKNYSITVTPTIENEIGPPTSKIITASSRKTPSPTLHAYNIDKTKAIISVQLIKYEDNMCEIKKIIITCNNNKTKNEFDENYKDSPQRNDIKMNITDLKPYQNYNCAGIIQNSNGNSTKSNEIHFQTEPDVPSKPTDLEINEITATGFNIIWQQPDYIPGLLGIYQIVIKNMGPDHFVPNDCPKNTLPIEWKFEINDTYHNFSYGQPNYKYEIKVTASTQAGFGLESTISTVTNSSVPVHVRNLVSVLNSDLEVNLNWLYPCEPNGKIDKFIIKVNGMSIVEDNEDDDIFKETKVLENKIDYNINIANLSYAFNYIAEVCPENYEDDCNKTTFITTDGLPQEPTSLSFTNIKSNEFLVHWKPPAISNGFLHSYNILIQPLVSGYDLGESCPQNYENLSKNLSKGTESFSFTEAMPFFNYRVFVKAATSKGFGPDTASNVRTSDTAPEKVKNLKTKLEKFLTENYNASLEITFSKPCYINGFFKQFLVFIRGYREEKFIEIIREINITSLTLKLLPEYNYQIDVIMQNQNYNSTSETASFISPPGIPPKVTKDLITPQQNEENPFVMEFLLDTDLFSDDNGKILYYAIIVAEKSFPNQTSFGEWQNSTWETGFATPPYWNPFDDSRLNYTYSLGNGVCNPDYCNGEFTPGEQYYLKVRGFTQSTYRDSQPVAFIIYKYNLLLIIGVILSVVTATLLLFILFYLRRKQLQVEVKRISNISNNIPLYPKPVPVKQFPKYYTDVKDNSNQIKTEFKELNCEPPSITAATLPVNKKKNRYVDILPFDTTRVILKSKTDSSDYINASFIKGYTGNVEYIASQGPLEHTCLDFWRMVLQENVTIIVMLTQLEENNKIKCHKYFPNNHENMEIGDDIEIRCANELDFGSYITRTFHIQKESEKWVATHLQFVDWPDFGCPKETQHMLQFCRMLRSLINKKTGMVVVHCSAGVGRTGTLIALDVLLQTIDDNKEIDVFGCVSNLRKQRMKMVQTEKQYLYIHNCLSDVIENPINIPEEIKVEDPIYENVEKCKVETSESVF